MQHVYAQCFTPSLYVDFQSRALAHKSITEQIISQTQTGKKIDKNEEPMCCGTRPLKMLKTSDTLLLLFQMPLFIIYYYWMKTIILVLQAWVVPVVMEAFPGNSTSFC